MSRIHGWCRFLLVGALLLGAVPALHAQGTGVPQTLDDQYAELAARVPGFGGLYLDEDGTTHVYLQDLSRAHDVQDLGERVVVQQGEYDFRDLYAWKAAVRPLLTSAGTVFLDIDESRNRLVFGVESDAIRGFSDLLARFLLSARVPSDAVIVEAAEPIVAMEQITDKIRPAPDGVEIQTAFGTCTLGVNVHRGVAGFITASHCTRPDQVQGGVDSTVFFQKSALMVSDRVGVETVDPPLFTGGSCPSGRQCRWSDAAFVAYDSPSLSNGGRIANPLICLPNAAGPLTVNPALPRLPITSYMFGSPASGTNVFKVGRSSGCTFGSQKNSCADVNVSINVSVGSFTFQLDTGRTLLCQNVVSGVALPGDSGSPVFLNQGDHATLVGNLWGGNSSIFAYSPWLFVFFELGPLVPDFQ